MKGAVEHFKVRDYECDLQGIVNNSVYQNYLEHAQHEFLRSLGVDVAGLAREGVNLVIVRSELDYRQPLRSGDEFSVHTRMERQSPVRIVFLQEIVRKSDGRLMLTGKMIGTAMAGEGRPRLPQTLLRVLEGGPRA